MNYSKHQLFEHINNAESIDDLVSMLRFVNLEKIKNIIREEVNESNIDMRRDMYLSSLPMTTILPKDMIQHITSYNPFQTKLIDKTFNECYQQHKSIKLREREQQISQMIGTNSNSKTWIVHQTRTMLTDEEKKLQYNGPVNSLMEAICSSESGDKILLSDGNYILDPKGFCSNRKNVQIIGCGNKVIFDEAVKGNMSTKSNLYFKNIKFNLASTIFCGAECTLYMEQCYLNDVFIVVNGHLNVANCNFKYHEKPAIHINYLAQSVFIENCIFNGCGLYAQIPSINVGARMKTQIQCVGNLFKNNNGFPIGTTYGRDDHELPHFDKSIFDNNTVKDNRRSDAMQYFLSIIDPKPPII